MPPTDAATLHGLVPGSTNSGEGYMIPCSSTVNVQFMFSGMNYTVPPKDYLGKPDSTGQMCASNILGHQAFGAGQWIMGDVFLKNVYTVMDFDKNQIGMSAAGHIHPSSLTASQVSPTKLRKQHQTRHRLCPVQVMSPGPLYLPLSPQTRRQSTLYRS